MDDTLHILLADYVPLANKGEEAIVCGIRDMLSDDRPVTIGLFDNVDRVTRRGEVTIFPRQWLFRFEGQSNLVGFRRVLRQVGIAAQLRLGLDSTLANLTGAGGPTLRPLHEFFERAQCVLVGHDGVFCVESCGIIRLARRHGKRVGILGASTGIGLGRFYKAGLYRRALDDCDFCVFRERTSCESMKQIAGRPEDLVLGPDPAFAMHPADPDEAISVLERYAPYRRAKSDGRPIVAATVLEKGRVYAGFRPDLSGPAKQQAHAEYVATILETLVKQYNAFVLFLPHSVEQDGNDILAAEHVADQMDAGKANSVILQEDCGARLLKGIIAQCEFLVGQRTHSLIASVSTATPFAALTNRRDTRTHGIIGEMCRCERQIVDMDVADRETASRKVAELFESRPSIRRVLGQTQVNLSQQIAQIAGTVKGSPAAPSGR